jgi:hypothetical protein
MPLPTDYDTPEGEELAEVAIRGAIKDCFLQVAENDRFGFTGTLAHTRLRYPDSNDVWDQIATIVDPDTKDAETEEQTRLIRIFAVAFVGFSSKLTELTIRYAIKVSFGFKDVYKGDATKNSSDELTALLMQYRKYLQNNLSLGLDDRVTHLYLNCGNVRFVPKDLQGNALQVADCSLSVVLGIC